MARLLSQKPENCLDCFAHHTDCCGDGAYATCKITHETIRPGDCLNEKGTVEGAFPSFCPLDDIL